MSIYRATRQALPNSLCIAATTKSHNQRCLQGCLQHAHVVCKAPLTCNKEDANIACTTSTCDRKEVPTLSPDFRDPQLAHGSKTNWELARAILVLNLCRVHFLVDHGSKIVEWSYRILGDSITNAVLRPLLFQQFCAGEDFKPTIDSLKNNGLQSILDYCAEADTSTTAVIPTDPSSLQTQERPNQPARIYMYHSEAQCDRHRDNFLACIKAVRDASPTHDGKGGFMALKVTALGNPQLLERVSPTILRLRELLVSRDLLLTAEDSPLSSLLSKLDPNNDGLIDFVSWSKHLSPSDLRWLSHSSHTIQMADRNFSALSEKEIHLMQDVHSRAFAIAAEAAHHGTKLLFDAEQTWVQPAIDNLVLGLQHTFNDTKQTDFPIIFHTYQCYLKDILSDINSDLERSQQLGYHLGAKLVRGAYIHSERQRANNRSLITSPIHDTLKDTHACYDSAIDLLLSYQPPQRTSCLSKIEVMIATHNEKSVEKTIQCMKNNCISKESGKVHFAQLLGMSDNLSFPLGKEGYSVFKYVPFGKVEEALPYLLRRAAENRDVLKSNTIGLQLLYKEIARRMQSHFRN